MMIDTFFRGNNNIEIVNKEPINYIQLKLPNHLIQLTKINYLAIVVVLKDSYN